MPRGAPVSQQQPHAQSQPQPQPKKKHTARNVILVILGLFVLGVGGFASFFGSAGKASK
jgi:flagellar basal body-associated protein FliL